MPPDATGLKLDGVINLRPQRFSNGGLTAVGTRPTSAVLAGRIVTTVVVVKGRK